MNNTICFKNFIVKSVYETKGLKTYDLTCDTRVRLEKNNRSRKMCPLTPLTYKKVFSANRAGRTKVIYFMIQSQRTVYITKTEADRMFFLI
jgi:hypothetical protein